ncbi:hypothetical protein POX_e06696 [Penicillium oxalicum]|nr:hypothetical protein POX_e06696 [Penicillium oxalicum]KAI2788675.1 hypothetical protein POX_e06696 [Penicillium oxalicum]
MLDKLKFGGFLVYSEGNQDVLYVAAELEIPTK